MMHIRILFALACLASWISFAAAQPQQQMTSGSHAESDSIGMRALLQQAEQHFAARDWTAALRDYTQLAERNPDLAVNWFRKAACCVNTRRFDEAIAAYDKCNELGYARRAVYQGLAACYMGKRDLDQAELWLKRLLALDPSAEEMLRTDRFRQAMGPKLAERVLGAPLAANMDRDAGWRLDLKTLTDTLHRSHYNIHAKTTEEVWQAETQRVHDAIPNLTDHEVCLEFMKLTALAGDGHTSFWPMYGQKCQFHMFPVLFYPFADGFYVRAADPAYASLVGGKVLRIGNLTIEQAFAGIEPLVAHENPMHHKLVAPSLLATAEMLQFIGAIDSPDAVSVTVEQDGREVTTTLQSVLWRRELLGSKDIAPNLLSMNSEAADPVPLWLQRPRDFYWFEYLPEERLLYFQFNQVVDKPDESFAEFVERMFATVDDRPVDTFVIDLRLNDGGSSEIYPPLINQLIRHPNLNQQGKLFTLTSRMTYSAAMNLATDLEWWTETMFVGEPTGCSPNFIGENKMFTLPYSGLLASVSDRYHQHGDSDSTDHRIWIAPELPAALSSRDFGANHDPGLAAIRQFVQDGKLQAADK